METINFEVTDLVPNSLKNKNLGEELKASEYNNTLLKITVALLGIGLGVILYKLNKENEKSI